MYISDSDYCNHCSISSVCNPGVDFKDAMRLGLPDLELVCHSYATRIIATIVLCDLVIKTLNCSVIHSVKYSLRLARTKFLLININI